MRNFVAYISYVELIPLFIIGPHTNVDFVDVKCDIKLCMTLSDPIMLAMPNNTAPGCVHVLGIISDAVNVMMNFLCAFRLLGFSGKFKDLRTITFLVPDVYADNSDK